MTVTFTTFSCTVTTVVQFANLIVCTFFYFFQKNMFKKCKISFFEKLNENDTSLYFITVEKVTISLPTKCLRNPTRGLVLIGD